MPSKPRKKPESPPPARGLPSDQPAERAVLASILLDNDVFDQAAALTEDDFILEKHRCIWRTMQTLHGKNQPIDYSTVYSEGQLLNGATPSFDIGDLTGLTDGEPQAANIGAYVAAVQKAAKRRRVIYQARSVATGAMHGEDPALLEARMASAVRVDKLPSTLDLLNALAIFEGRIRFSAVKARGPMIIAEFDGGGEAIWHTMTDLMSFARSQIILAEATRTVIPTPPRSKIKTTWEPVAQLILRLAGADRVMSTDALREEFRHIVEGTWKSAGCPNVDDDGDFFEVLRECLDHHREPAAVKPPRRCVWHDGKYSYVHLLSLVEWLSTPAGRNKHYDWGQVRNALLLLDFVPEQIHRSFDGLNVNVRLWRGPLDLLVDDET